jgi:small-conductance mechanosensitive channel
MQVIVDALNAAWNSISWTTLGWVIIDAVVALLVGSLLYWFIRFWGLRYAQRTSTASDDFMVSLAARVVQFTVYFIGLMLILGRLGVNLAPLLTGAGVFGLLLGLIGRDLFANTLAGLWLISERPYDIGQRILLPKSLGDIHGSWGDVVSIGLRSTHVLSVDGVMLTIPNSTLVNDTIANFGYGPSARMRARVRVGVAPDAENVRRAIEVGRAAIAATPGVCEDPKPVEVLARDFRDWDVLLEARFFVGGPSAFRAIKSDAIQAILVAFEDQGVQLSQPVTRVALSEVEASQIYDETSR